MESKREQRNEGSRTYNNKTGIEVVTVTVLAYCRTQALPTTNAMLSTTRMELKFFSSSSEERFTGIVGWHVLTHQF